MRAQYDSAEAKKNCSPINHKIHCCPMIFRTFLPISFHRCSLAGRAETTLQLILNMWMNACTWQCLIELDSTSNRMPTRLKCVFAYFLWQIIMRSTIIRRTTLVKSVGRRPAASSFKRKKLRCGVKDDGHAHKCSRVARTPLMYL